MGVIISLMLKKLLIFAIIFVYTSIGGRVMAASNYLDLNIMSFNLLYGQTSSSSRATAQYIYDNNIDIAFFQEVDVFDDDLDEVGIIISSLHALSDDYKYSFVTSHIGESGLMIISKYPLAERQEILAHRYRKLQTAVVLTPNGYFRVFNVHLNSPDDSVVTCPALSDHLNIIKTYNDYPHILVGDFNIQFNLESYKSLCSGMLADYKGHTCPVGSGCGISHRAAGSLVDYLFVQKDPIILKSGYIAQNTGELSDHFPLLAVIRLNGKQFNYKYDTNLDQKFDILDAIKLIQTVFGG